MLRGWWIDETAVDLLAGLVLGEKVATVLDNLIAASLLVSDVDGPVRRLRAYEPVRQDALRRLRDSGDEPQAHAAHLRTHLRLVARVRPHLRGPDETTWLDTVDRSREDIYAALEYARDQGDRQALVELVTGCSRMWSLRWSPALAMPWLRTALAATDDDSDLGGFALTIGP